MYRQPTAQKRLEAAFLWPLPSVFEAEITALLYLAL
jgi:hypothetical protein